MTDFTYPDRLPITPLTKPPVASVTVPGSKSITNRALVLAALGSRNGDCTLTGALRCEDTEVMIDCLGRLGFAVEADWRSNEILVRENTSERIIPAKSADLYVANSGTTMRFLTAAVCLGEGTYRFDGVSRMRERPIRNLLDALNQLPGVSAESEAGTGCPPVVVRSTGVRGGTVRVRADVSSQFLSGLLLAAPFADDTVIVHIDGPSVSEPYIEMTTRMLTEWGLTCRRSGNEFIVASIHAELPTSYFGRYAIEPDASAASYFWAAAAITGGSVEVADVTSGGLQGDVRFAEVLEQMGCRVVWHTGGTIIEGHPLSGIDIDMNAISDTVMTLGAVACFADGPTTIRNVAHIRHKETDRIAALATELRKLGAEVDEFPDGLRITPRPLTGCTVDTYNDHRMAMSLALVGLKVPGVVINNPSCVAKTYPGFWQDLEALRV